MNKFEKKKLEEVANDSLYTTFTNSKTINYSFEIFSRFRKNSVFKNDLLSNRIFNLVSLNSIKVIVYKLKIEYLLVSVFFMTNGIL